MIIHSENTEDPDDDSVTVIWWTNKPATSRVLYDTVSHPVLGAALHEYYQDLWQRPDEDAEPNTATANGLTITSIDIVNAPVIPSSVGKAGESSLIKGVGVLKNSIRLTGTYDQLKSFLQGIETGVRIASISSVKIDKIANPITPGTVGITVEVETYYQIN